MALMAFDTAVHLLLITCQGQTLLSIAQAPFGTVLLSLFIMYQFQKTDVRSFGTVLHVVSFTVHLAA